MRTYNIYTLICKNRLGNWSDLQGFGCFVEDANAAAEEWKSKGLTVAVRIDTYKHAGKLAAPISTRTEGR